MVTWFSYATFRKKAPVATKWWTNRRSKGNGRRISFIYTRNTCDTQKIYHHQPLLMLYISVTSTYLRESGTRKQTCLMMMIFRATPGNSEWYEEGPLEPIAMLTDKTISNIILWAFQSSLMIYPKKHISVWPNQSQFPEKLFQLIQGRSLIFKANTLL